MWAKECFNALMYMLTMPKPRPPSQFVFLGITIRFLTIYGPPHPPSPQLSLSALVGTQAAASFSEELGKWHKQLQTVEEVLGAWLAVQGLWVLLEEVCASAEVLRHLPAHAFTFANVDREWREMMALTARNPAVMAACLKEGGCQRGGGLVGG